MHKPSLMALVITAAFLASANSGAARESPAAVLVPEFAGVASVTGWAATGVAWLVPA